MRILIAANSYPTEKNPSSQVFVRNIYKGLKKKFTSVDLVFNHYYKWFKSDLGTGTIITSGVKIAILFYSYLPYMLGKAKDYDIIYSHGELLPGIFIPIIQRLYGIKHVCYVHGSANDFAIKNGVNFKLARYVFRKSDYLVTNSKFMQEVIEKNYGFESRVITPGYNSEIFTGETENREIDICFAGSAVYKKGTDLILKAVKNHIHFYEKHDLKIHLYIDGELKNELLTYIANHTIAGLVNVYGRLQDIELADTFRKSKIVLFPSREEPLGLIGIEAIACGCILIAAGTGGIPEYAKDKKNSFLFERGNSEDLQDKIEYVYENYTSIKSQFYGNDETVKDFTLENGIEQTVDFFNSIQSSV